MAEVFDRSTMMCTSLQSLASENLLIASGSYSCEVNEPLSWLVTCDEWGSKEEQVFETWFKAVGEPPLHLLEEAWLEVVVTFVPLCLVNRRLELFQRILDHYPKEEVLLERLQETIIKHSERIMNDPELFVVVRHSCPNAIREGVFEGGVLPISLELMKEGTQGFEHILSKCQYDQQVVKWQEILRKLLTEGGMACQASRG